MYPDAFTIERLADELKSYLNGCNLKDIFSTSKTDLFFVFSDKKGFKMRFFQGQAFFQFPGIETFPLKNRMSRFAKVHSQLAVNVNAHSGSRSFDIEFENGHRLLFKIFGKFSNVILFDEKPLEIFCLNHQKDLQTPLNSYVNNRDINFELNDEKEFLKYHNWFAPDALNYLIKSGYFKNGNPETAYENFKICYQSSDVYIAKTDEHSFELSCFTDENKIESYAKITDALNDFAPLYIAAESFKINKQNKIGEIERQINQKIKLRFDLLQSLDNIKQKRSYRISGDLIMANLHSIHEGISRVEVFDFYSNSKTFIKIKPDLSPQQNAALFYQKAKNEIKEVEYKHKALAEVTHLIEKLKDKLEKLKSADSSKKLRPFEKTPSVKSKEKQRALPYRIFTIGGFDVLVGKNAKDNDELLSKYSSKNDLWFHAKDVSGSHVIIKNPTSKPVPSPVLHEAASLAAWYSKSKSNSLATVIYTLRKYVRKPKGAPPGLVSVERETGILVKPSDALSLLKDV